MRFMISMQRLNGFRSPSATGWVALSLSLTAAIAGLTPLALAQGTQVVQPRTCSLPPIAVPLRQLPADPNWATLASQGKLLIQTNQNLDPLRKGISGQWVTSLSFSPDGQTLVSGSRYLVVGGKPIDILGIGVPSGARNVFGGVDLWSGLKTSPWHASVLYNSPREINSVVFSPNGEFLAAAGNDKGFVGLWTRSQLGGKTVAPKAQSNSQFSVNAIAFSPNSQMLASAGIRGRSGQGHAIQRWDVRGGSLRPLSAAMQNVAAFQRSNLLEDQEVYSIAFSPNSKLLAGGGMSSLFERQGTVVKPLRSISFLHLWDPATGKYLCSMGEADASPVSAVAFSPDGSLLASGGTNGKIQLWSLTNGQLLRTLDSHTIRVNSLAFSPSGEILLSGSKDRSVKIWQTKTGQLLQTLNKDAQGQPLFQDEVTSVVFQPNGQAFAVGSKDNSIHLFLAPSE